MDIDARDVVERVSPDGGVVVGDDGSPGARTAILFALDEARRRGSALHVLRAWSITSAARPTGSSSGYVPSMVEFQQATLEAERERVRQLCGEAHGVDVQVHVAHSPSAQSLIEASRTCDLVVVGSRGRGGFASLVLGSVALQCVAHAHCPVTVVR